MSKMVTLEKPIMTMSSDITAALARAREKLSTPVDEILAGCHDLAKEIRAQGLSDFAGDGDDVVHAADELLGSFNVILDEAVAASNNGVGEVGALQKRLRHDLKNSVAVVLGNLEMMQEDLDDAGASSLLNAVTGLVESAGRLSRMIDEVVTLAAPTRRRA